MGMFVMNAVLDLPVRLPGVVVGHALPWAMGGFGYPTATAVRAVGQSVAHGAVLPVGPRPGREVHVVGGHGSVGMGAGEVGLQSDFREFPLEGIGAAVATGARPEEK